MRMKLFFAAVAVLFTVGVVTSCGNKKAANTDEVTADATEQVEKCCKSDSLACCDQDKAECDSTKACCKENKEGCDKKEACDKK